MPVDEKENQELQTQKKWYENRYEIISRLDELILCELSRTANLIDLGLVSKLVPARIAFFNELVILSDRAQLQDVHNAFALGSSAVGGNA